MKESIEKSVEANKDFLHKITEYYQQKGNIPTSYNIARKEAFLETSNLNSAFQRMAQEPKSKQKNITIIYELLVLNHTFLASLASLSTYIKHHKPTEASKPFKMATEEIEKKLGMVLLCLKERECEVAKESPANDLLFEELLPTFNSFEIKNVASADQETERALQETHLIWEQLQWLFSISGKMMRLVSSVKLD
jgi:uncharacterized membrane protein YccC